MTLPELLDLVEAEGIGKRKPMAAYRFGSLEGTLFRPDESGQVSMIG
jgi:hypothetical protein